MKDDRKTKKQLLDELLELRQRVAVLETTGSESGKTGHRLTTEVAAISAVVNDMLLGEVDDSKTEKRVLDSCLIATHSVYGMIGKVNEHGKYDTTTYSGRALKDCAFPEALAWELSTGMTIRGIWGWPILHGKPLICNDLKTHPDSVGSPEGHTPILCFLGVPLKREENIVGMVAVANKPGGYTQDDRNTLVRLASIISVSRQHRQAQQAMRRTAEELVAVNEELEAFSYSVSHDLRAPLRAIDGFSKMLVEDYGANLDTEGRRLLGVIQSSVGEMGQLIDDLLAFSRLGRKEISKTHINMRDLAEEVFRNLETEILQGEVQFNVESVPSLRGDRTLIREVLKNLISNAVKFARHRELTVIEISGRVEGNEHLYTITDNGVGFDMKYADKLFKPFQRLHSSGEFEGTGIGLALSHHIIHRHGGRVWAESKIGEGAVFHFAIPR